MRAPSDKRSEDEIVTDIIKCVKCPPKVAPYIEPLVRRLMGDLRTLREPFTGNQKENIEFAEKLHNQITKLEHTLKNTPSSFLSSFLFEERFWQIWADAQETQINANTRSYIAQERAHQNHLAAILGQLRVRCDEIIKRKPGIHGGIKYQHRHAARASHTFLEAVAIHTETELQLTCSPTSKFVEAARLFHEAATGEDDADLRRACKALKAELRTKK
jgi:hypothetical protein